MKPPTSTRCKITSIHPEGEILGNAHEGIVPQKQKELKSGSRENSEVIKIHPLRI